MEIIHSNIFQFIRSLHSFDQKSLFFRKNAVQMSYAIMAFLIALKMSEIQFRLPQGRNRLTIFSSTLKCWNAKIDPIQLRILLQIYPLISANELQILSINS